MGTGKRREGSAEGIPEIKVKVSWKPWERFFI